MFTLPSEGEHEPAAIYERLINSAPEFAHLHEWRPDVAFILRDDPESQNQRSIIGTCSMPTVQGRHRRLFTWLMERQIGYEPVFLFTLDKAWWEAASPHMREILMFHEMLHAGIAKDAFGCDKFHRETGVPIWAIVGHDVEEFEAVVRRYGAWDQALVSFQTALNSHGGEA